MFMKLIWVLVSDDTIGCLLSTGSENDWVKVEIKYSMLLAKGKAMPIVATMINDMIRYDITM